MVHSDLKSENVLMSFDYKKQKVKSIKIIDYGSCFNFNKVNDEIGLTTPEYLPPEILNFLEFKQLNAMGASYND